MKVRKNYLIALGVACCIFIVVGYFVWKDSQFVLYDSPSAGVQIKYPKGWEVQEEVSGAVAFVSPLEGELDVFQENANVSISPLGPRRLIIKEYTAMAKKQLKAAFKDKIKFEVSEPAYLSERAGHKIIYQLDALYPIRIMHVYMLKNNNAYTFTFSAEADVFDEYKDVMNTMVRSLVVK